MVTFVSADWVSDHVGRPGFLIIDPRSAMRYLMGHLKGAVSVPFKKLQNAQGRLNSAHELAAVFGAVGLGDGVVPVIYDGHDGRNAAMAAWILEYLGRDDIHIMDLLYDSWKSEGREVLYRPVPTAAKPFTPSVNSRVRASIDDVVSLSAGKLLDTRSLEEFQGEVETDDRPGHIPGATHLPWSELAGEDGRLLVGDDQLRQALASVEIQPEDSVVAYCRSGVRAALAYLAMKQAGYNVRLFDGSYGEWMDSGQPVEI